MEFMGKLELRDMVFFAHHGCFEQERVIGNRFIVDFEAVLDVSIPAKSDDINDALNYQRVYELIKEQMEIPSNLLEHIAARIIKRIRDSFPYVDSISISISKVNPPLGGEVGASKITIRG